MLTAPLSLNSSSSGVSESARAALKLGMDACLDAVSLYQLNCSFVSMIATSRYL